MKQINRISVIMPFYKESVSTVLDGVKKISNYFTEKNIQAEIFISQNGTNEELKIKLPDTKIVYDPRKGLGRAIKNGIKQANNDYSYFVSIEVPYNLSKIEEMLNSYQDADIIIGSKLHSQSIYKIALKRKLVSQIISRLTMLLLPRFDIHDPNGTLFGKTSVFKKYGLNIKSDDYFFSTEFLAICRKNNIKVIEVPVQYIKNDSKTSVKLSDGLIYIWRLLKLSLQYNFS